MSYQVVVPLSGYAGWAALNRTMDTQKVAFNESTVIQRETDYFRENIGSITSAEELMADRQLLTVALGAFGLDDDIDSTYFIQKVLEDGTEADNALANKLTDSSYFNLSQAFGFGDSNSAGNDLSTIAEDIITRHQDKQFAISVGETDENMRLALNIEAALPDIASADSTDNGRWYSILGNESVRTVFETALGLPDSIGTLDIDLQVSQFRDKAERYFGDGEISQFSDPANRDELVRLFMARSEIAELSAVNSSAQNALTLLSGN